MGHPHCDEAAQVQCGGAVVQPVIVSGDAAVAEIPVPSGQPGDGSFDHRTVLTILVEPSLVFVLLTGPALECVVGWRF